MVLISTSGMKNNDYQTISLHLNRKYKDQDERSMKFSGLHGNKYLYRPGQDFPQNAITGGGRYF